MKGLVNTDKMLFEAAKTRAAGVEVIAVGVGDQINQGELRQLTSPPQVISRSNLSIKVIRPRSR